MNTIMQLPYRFSGIGLPGVGYPFTQPLLFGPTASDPVVCRLITALAADAPRALKAMRGGWAARKRPGQHSGHPAKITKGSG
jgi:hypothetical protein